MSIDEVISGIRRVIEYPLFTMGERQFALQDFIFLVFLVIGVLILSTLFRRLVLERVLKRTRLASGMQYTISKVTGYLFIAVGLYMALQVVGIDLSALAVVAGAVGVGVGFGLQNIVNNFFSGLIILAERPITIGDRVEVGGVAGLVKQISLRSTTIVTNDNITMIVPNSDFITNPVTNWSHGDPKVRLRIPFGVAYGSDIQLMRRVVIEMAKQNTRVLKSKEPIVFFTGFGDSSLDFELVIWTEEATFAPDGFRSDLYYGLEQTLRDHEIEIPFPQRDLHLRSGHINTQPESGGGSATTITS